MKPELCEHEDLRLPRGRVEVGLTLAPHRHGAYDPTCRRLSDGFIKAFFSPEGPVTLEIRQLPGEWGLRAWGPGRNWVLDRAGLILQPTDPDLPAHASLPVRRLAMRGAGLRVVRLPWMECLATALVLQQRVTTGEAFAAYRKLAQLRGQAAPGPHSLLLPPQPYRWATPAHLARMGIDAKRAGTLMALRWVAKRLQRAVEHSAEEVRSWLLSVPGIGPWTCENAMGMSMGDPDAVPTGDLHFPHIVSEKLTGVGWSNDAEMLRLLEPYRGCRYRVLRLLVGFVPA